MVPLLFCRSRFTRDTLLKSRVNPLLHGLILLLFALCLSGAAQAAGVLEAWRAEAARVRFLAENDLAQADNAVQRLERNFPTDAKPADRLRLLNLRGRIALYRAESEKAAAYARQATELALRQGDKVELVEADLIVALNAVNQNRLESMYASASRAFTSLQGVDRPDLLSEAMLRVGMMYRRKGQFDASITMAMQQMEIAERSTDPIARAYAYQGLAMAYNFNGYKEKALDYFQRMQSEARRAPSKLLEASALLEIGDITWASGQKHEAEKQMREAIAMFRAVGGAFYVCHANYILADLLRLQGRTAEAQLLLEESIQIYERHDNKIGLWWALKLRSQMRQDLRRFDDAQADAERISVLAREIKLPLYLGESDKRLGELAMARGDHREAALRLQEAYELAQRVERDKAGERMIEIAERYDKDSEKRQIEALNRAAEHQAQHHRWLWTVLGASLLILAVTVYFLLRLRRKKRLIEAVNSQLRQTQSELRESEQRYREIFDNVLDTLYLLEVTPEGRFRNLEVNPAFEKSSGIPSAALIGKFVEEVVPEETANIAIAKYRRCIEAGTAVDEEATLDLPSGVRHYHSTLIPVRDDSGRIHRIVGISRDITERKQAEQQLWLKDFALNQVSEATYLIDIESLRFTHVNDEACRALGYSREELLGMTVFDIDPDVTPEVFAQLAKDSAIDGASVFERRHQAKDGRTFPVEISAKIFEYEGRWMSISLARDITERKRLEQAILAREAELRSVADSAPYSILRYDLDFRMTYANAPLLGYFGIPLADLVGKRPCEVWPDERFAEMDRGIKQVRETETDVIVEFSETTAGGEMIHHQVWIVPERDASDEMVGIIAFGLNITERKQAEQQLWMMDFALNQVSEAAYLIEPQNLRFIYVNDQACRELGYSREELLHLTVYDIDPDATPEDMAALSRQRNAAGSFVVERRHQAKDGSVFPVEIQSTTFEYDGRHMSIALARDITERKSAEALLYAREQEFRAMVENSPDIIARYDNECRRIYVNPAMQAQFGLPVEEILGKTPTEFSALSDALAYQQVIRDVFESGREVQAEFSFIPPKGSARWGHMRVVPEFGTDGAVTNVLAITRDITALKKAERKIEAAYAQVQELAARREEALEDERKRIAHDMHDELGQYLTALRMGISVLRMRFGENNPEMQERVQSLLSLVDRTIQVVRDMAKRLRPAPLEMGVVSALEWLAEDFSGRTGVRCELDTGIEEIAMSDNQATAIFRVAQESLTNVVRYAAASRVDIHLQTSGTDYLLTICDDGKGFDSDGSPKKSFGLVGIRERASMLGGAAMISSVPGRGTTIEVRIPIHEPQGET